MDIFSRATLIEAYAQKKIENMDIAEMEQIIAEQIAENADLLSDDELANKIKNEYPELLGN